jgi:hypothetical protein
VWGIFQDIASVAPGTYTGQAFIRPVGNGGPFMIDLVLVALDDAGAQVPPVVERPITIALGGDWAPVTAGLSVGPGQGASVGLLTRNAGTGGCFLVDDVSLVRE